MSETERLVVERVVSLALLDQPGGFNAAHIFEPLARARARQTSPGAQVRHLSTEQRLGPAGYGVLVTTWQVAPATPAEGRAELCAS